MGLSKQSHSQRLIDTFVNRIYLYDDKLIITFNHKDGAQTITLGDIETALAEKENGSDLVGSAVPKNGKHRWCFPFFDTPGGTRKGGLAEGKVTKCPVDTLLARGRVPPVSDASRRDVDETGTGSMPKSAGMVHLFQKSHKNTRTKNGLSHPG